MTPNDSNLTDYQLINNFVNDNNSAAFETLLRRHYNQVHKRFMGLTKNQADADDLSQKLWMRVLRYLPKYQDNELFPNFLNKIATNLMKDEWRKQGARPEQSFDELYESNAEGSLDEGSQVSNTDLTEQIHNQSEIAHLIKELIPNLPLKLRSVFLLRHESEYWDGKQPFQWQHLGELNKVSAEVSADSFTLARDKLLTKTDELEELEQLIFVVWTQAQRLDKAKKQTETYLASLINIPVNTFKTRYRTALSELSTQLTAWREQNAAHKA